jgi:hypothetical protein
LWKEVEKGRTFYGRKQLKLPKTKMLATAVCWWNSGETTNAKEIGVIFQNWKVRSCCCRETNATVIGSEL